jgi:elongation factor G
MSVLDVAEKNGIELAKLRNIGIMAHIDAGKTTVAERILYYTGRTHRMGDVDEGNTTMDWMDQEQERGITIVSAATTTSWRDHRINLIDTPGHVDFTVEVERSLRVLDGVIALFCGVGGVEAQSEVVWRQAAKYGVPAVAFVNKMDRVGADFGRVLAEMQERLGTNPVPVAVPLFEDGNFVGILDLVAHKAVYYNEDDLGATFRETDVPEALSAEFERWYHRLVHDVSEADEVLFEKYCLDEPITEEELRRALRRGTISGQLVPVLCGSALKNKGIQRLLDAVVDYLPSPMDLPPVKAHRPDGEAVQRRHAVDEAVTALAFKVVTDRHSGALTYLRVYSGRLEVGSYIFNATKAKRQRISRLMLMHADRREPCSTLSAGEIGVAVGLGDTGTGDTLCEEENPVLLEAIVFPTPVLAVSIKPGSSGEKDRLSNALACLAAEDPTFTVGFDAETSETIVSGMGELHLEVFVERLRREFGVKPEVSAPRVAYRETIRKPARIVHKHVKQTGGHGQYAHVVLEIKPLESGQGFEFTDEVKGGNVPREYIPAVERGVRDALAEGVLTGSPVVDVAVCLVDGSFHEVDSSDLAFRTCGRDAFKKAFLEGKPVLLEPVFVLNVVAPEEFSGAVTASICSRRGRIVAIEARGGAGAQAVRGMVPLAETFGYATEVRSITGGRAGFDMRFERYEPVPAQLAEEIIKTRREEKE